MPAVEVVAAPCHDAVFISRLMLRVDDVAASIMAYIMPRCLFDVSPPPYGYVDFAFDAMLCRHCRSQHFLPASPLLIHCCRRHYFRCRCCCCRYADAVSPRRYAQELLICYMLYACLR